MNQYARRAVGIALPAALLGASGVAHGEQIVAPDRPDVGQDITITGQRLAPEEVRRQAVDFIKQTGVATGQQTVARWEMPVCPRAYGLAATHRAAVEQRLRLIAVAAGSPVAADSCRANIAITFTTPAPSLLRKIAVRSPRSLSEVEMADRRELLEGPAPIRWWYTTQTRGRDGNSINGDPPSWASGNTEGGGGSPLPSTGQGTLLNYTSSIVSTQVVRELKTATVIIDVKSVEGLPLSTVSSFAAMVAFAEIRPQSSPRNSILSLFASDDRPSAFTLTDRDKTFLSALYRLPLDRTSRQQRGFLVRELISAERGE